MQHAWWVLIGLSCLGCSKKETPSTHPSAEPVVSAAPSPSVSAKAEEEPSPFQLVKKFPSGKFFAVGSAAIVCEGRCVFQKGPAPKVWLVQGEKVKEAPELWPGHAYQQYLSTLVEEDEGSAPVVYDGEYPNKLYAIGVSGTRTWGGLPAVKFNKKYWAESRNASVRDQEHVSRPLPPREYDEALMAAPVSYTPTARFFFGAGGPTIVLDSHDFHVWDGKTWSKRAAPWNETPEGVRLKDGSTLATTESGAFVIDREGRATAVKLPEGATKVASHRIAGSVWLTATEDGISVFRPREAAGFEVFEEPKRKPYVRRQTAPVAGGETDGADAAPPAQMSPVPFTDSCTTPFVILATPPRLDGSFPTIAKGISGHTELAGKVSFVAYKQGAQAYVGAQAKDEASARKLVDTIKASIPGIRPQLVCLDALSKIPDPYDPPEGMRRVWLHVGSGVDLRLK